MPLLLPPPSNLSFLLSLPFPGLQSDHRRHAAKAEGARRDTVPVAAVPREDGARLILPCLFSFPCPLACLVLLHLLLQREADCVGTGGRGGLHRAAPSPRMQLCGCDIRQPGNGAASWSPYEGRGQLRRETDIWPFWRWREGDADGRGQGTVRSRGERSGCWLGGKLEKQNNLCLIIAIYFEFIIYSNICRALL